MAVAVDATGTVITGTVSPVSSSSSITVGASATDLWVVVQADDATASISAPTWNGVAMTLIGSVNTSDNSCVTKLYGMVSPASGAKTLSVSWSGGAPNIQMCAQSHTGSDSSSVANCFKNFVSQANNVAGASQTVTVTSATGDMTVAAGNGNNASYSSFTGTVIYTNGAAFTGEATRQAGAASVTFTGALSASVTNCIAGCDIAAASGAAAVEGPPHFIPKSFPPQWNVDRKLLLHRSPGPEASSAVETNTHFIPCAFPPQWNLNRSLFNRRPGPEASSAVETNPHWRAQTWRPQWNINDSPNTLWNSAGDVPSVVVADTPPPFVPRTWPIQWNANLQLKQNAAQDFSSSAVETNPHWVGKPWPLQWIVQLSLRQAPATDVPIITAADTPACFVPLQWESQWNVDVSLVQGGAQDGSSSAVETNPHWIGKPWPAQWILRPSLWQVPAMDALIVQTDTPIYFIPRQLPLQWNLNHALGQNTAQDFSSSAIETNTYSNLHAWAPQWAPRWQLQASLMQVTAQDFSSTAPIQTTFEWLIRARRRGRR